MSGHVAPPGTRGPLRGHLTADLVLLGVTAGWGVTFPAIKIAVAGTDPMVFMALRFGLSTIILWLMLGRGFTRGFRSIAGPGAILGAFLFGSYAFQALGLQTTSATRSAFLTGLSIVIVPILYMAIRRRLPGTLTMLGVALSLSGLFLMTRPDLGQFELGDGLTLLCSTSYAFYVVFLEVYTTGRDSEPFIGYQSGFMTLAAVLLAAPGLGAGFQWSRDLAIGLIITVPVTVFTLIGITRFQAKTTATRAALIYAAEPVFAWLFASVWLGERLDASGLGGVALIMAGVLMAVFG